MEGGKRKECHHEEGIPPRDHPEQGVIDPLTGRNVTGEFHDEARREMERDLDEMMGSARKRSVQGEDPTAIFTELRVRLAMSGLTPPRRSSTADRFSRSWYVLPLVVVMTTTSGFVSLIPPMI